MFSAAWREGAGCNASREQHPGSPPAAAARDYRRRMGRQAALVLYVLAMVAVVIGVDVLFFRNRFWERLMVNVGIVLVFAAFYSRFLKRP